MPDLSSLGTGSAGLWTRAQALGHLSRGQLQHRLDTQWQSPFPGVCADAGFALDAVQWAWAAVLASGGAPSAGRPTELRAVACGRSAARVGRFPLVDDDDPATGGQERFVHDVHTWRRLGRLTSPPLRGQDRGHQLHRHTLALRPGDLVQHESGLWLTSPLRTALDCAVLLPHEAAVCVLDHGLHVGAFTAAELHAALAARAGHPHVERQRAVCAAADPRAEAPSETLARLLLRPALPELEPQVPLRDERGREIARFYLGLRAVQLGVDVDGKRARAGERMVAKDRRRDRRTEPWGWWTERLSWYEIRRQRQQTGQRVVARARQRADRAA